MKIFKKIKEKIFGRSISPIQFNENYIFELSAKAQSLEKELANINTLALGSSHGAYGINPIFFETKTFNLCSTSQDLYYSFMLYKMLHSKIPNLNKVILVYSAFSAGFEVQKTVDKEVCAYFKFLYSIKYKYLANNELGQHYKNCKKKLQSENFKNIEPQNVYGYNSPLRFFPPDYPVEKRAQAHLRENMRGNNQIDNIKKLSNLCKKNGHNLNIVITPVRKDYLSQMPAEDVLFEKLLKIASDISINVINMYSSREFVDDDFGDFDHLNLRGAEKLSKILNGYLIR